jgi:hypothetical protein
MLMRGQGVLWQVNVKIHKAKLRYQYACNALMRLRGHGSWENELKVLDDVDVRALNERALMVEEAEQRKTVHDLEDVVVEEEGSVAALGVVALGESRRTLSWIWYTARPTDPTEAELVEGKHVYPQHYFNTEMHPSATRRVVQSLRLHAALAGGRGTGGGGNAPYNRVRLVVSGAMGHAGLGTRRDG